MRRVLAALAVSAAFAAVPAVAEAYTGPGGCPSPIAPWSSVSCAYHTNVQRFIVWANGSHKGWIMGLIGSCYGNPCMSDTGRRRSLWSGRPTVINSTGHWLYVGTYLYQ